MKAQRELVLKGSYVKSQFWYKRAIGFSLNPPPLKTPFTGNYSLAFQSTSSQNCEGELCYGEYMISL